MTGASDAVRFTILICTKNRCESLSRTLAAIEDLADAGQRELVVVDNGSTDDTANVVARASASSRRSLRYICCDTRGKSAALNVGIAAARGEIVAFTDDDALPARNWLVEIDRVFRQRHCDWVYGPVVPMWESQQPSWFSPELGGLFALLDLGPQAFVATNATPAFAGVNCATSREALSKVGGYRTDLGPKTIHGGGGEDTEMFHRCIGLGQVIVYDPSITVTHVIPASRTTKTFHRSRMISGWANNYRLTVAQPAEGPRVLGIPRFYYGLAVSSSWRWVWSTFRRDAASAFKHEIFLIRFTGLLRHGIAQSVFGRTLKSDAGPGTTTQPDRKSEIAGS